MAAIWEHHMVSQRAALEHTLVVFRLAGLPPREQVFSTSPHAMSGGVQRRVMVALALARQPALLIADEPTTGLEAVSKAQVLALLKELRATAHSAVLLISHDLGVVAQLADEVAVPHAGRVVEHGPVGAVLTQPKHPYTVGLLHTTPVPGQRDARLRVLPGALSDAPHPSRGCPFAPRCPHVMALCRK